MKKILLLIFITLVPFSSYATFLICDEGVEKSWIGGESKTEPAGNFEVEVLDNNQVLLDNVDFCKGKALAKVIESGLSMSCYRSDEGIAYDGSLEISRRTGTYLYNFKLRLRMVNTDESKIIAWYTQTGNCKASEKSLS